MKQKGIHVALSAGGKNEELAAQGLGVEHVEELMVRLAMQLLRDGHRLVFGGTLGNSEQPLTAYLIDTAQSWLDSASAQKTKVTRPTTWPLVNYAAWPFYTYISEEQRAQLVGTCRFVNVNPPRVSDDDLQSAVGDWYANPQARLYAADALTAMREKSTRTTQLRIVWAGKIAGATGWMAGILEEVAFSLAHKKPLLVLGGFGGCARLLADFLADKNASWPAELSLAACADPERDDLLTEAKRQAVATRFAQAQERLAEFRAEIHSASTVHGISSQSIRDSLHQETVRRIIRTAAEVARDCPRSP